MHQENHSADGRRSSPTVTNTISSVTVKQTTDALQEELLFLCDVTLADRTHPSAFVLELTWLVEGRPVATEEVSVGQRRTGLLRESHWSMGQTVSGAKHRYGVVVSALCLERFVS